jgi:hypothetical protein
MAAASQSGSSRRFPAPARRSLGRSLPGRPLHRPRMAGCACPLQLRAQPVKALKRCALAAARDCRLHCRSRRQPSGAPAFSQPKPKGEGGSSPPRGMAKLYSTGPAVAFGLQFTALQPTRTRTANQACTLPPCGWLLIFSRQKTPLRCAIYPLKIEAWPPTLAPAFFLSNEVQMKEKEYL